jgi:uncharacterized protein YlxP (DUF503 family)
MQVDVYVGLVRVELVVPGARSLKELRRPTVSLRDRLAARFGLSVHQVGSASRPARAVLVGVTVGNDPRELWRLLDRAVSFAHMSASPVSSAVVDVFPWQERGTIDAPWVAERWSGDE